MRIHELSSWSIIWLQSEFIGGYHGLNNRFGSMHPVARIVDNQRPQATSVKQNCRARTPWQPPSAHDTNTYTQKKTKRCPSETQTKNINERQRGSILDLSKNINIGNSTKGWFGIGNTILGCWEFGGCLTCRSAMAH